MTARPTDSTTAPNAMARLLERRRATARAEYRRMERERDSILARMWDIWTEFDRLDAIEARIRGS